MQGCAQRIIEGSPVLSTCGIQGAYKLREYGQNIMVLLVLFCFHFREIAKETDLPPIHVEAVTFKSILLQALDSLHGKVPG